MKRIFAGLCVCVLLIISVSGCSPMPKRDALKGAEPKAAVESEGGWASAQGSWIYYINGMPLELGEDRFAAESGALCRMKADGTQKVIVSPQVIESFVIMGNYIYYTTPVGEKMELARIKSDGTGYKRLDNADSASPLRAINSAVYYTKEHSLYSVGENSKSKLITKVPVMQIEAENSSSDNLFLTEFIDKDVPGSLYTVKDGQVKKILNGAYKIYDVFQGAAYVYSYDDGTIMKVNVDGKAEKLLYVGYDAYYIDAEANIAISGNWRSESGVFITTISDGQQKRLSQNAALTVTLHDSWVYYVNQTDNSVWRVKIDGTGDECIVSESVLHWNELDTVKGLLFYSPDNLGMGDNEVYAYSMLEKKATRAQFDSE